MESIVSKESIETIESIELTELVESRVASFNPEINL